MRRIEYVYVWCGVKGPSVGFFDEGWEAFFLGVTKASLSRLVGVINREKWHVSPALMGEVGYHARRPRPLGGSHA